MAEALATVATDEGTPAFPPGDVARQGNQAIGREALLDMGSGAGPFLQVAALVGDQAHFAAEAAQTHFTLVQFRP